MNSAVTAILTDETARTTEAIEQLFAQTINKNADPWAFKAEALAQN